MSFEQRPLTEKEFNEIKRVIMRLSASADGVPIPLLMSALGYMVATIAVDTWEPEDDNPDAFFTEYLDIMTHYYNTVKYEKAGIMVC